MKERQTKLTVLSTVASAPKISLKGKWKEQKSATLNNPGPGAYTPIPERIMKKEPTVTIQGKHAPMNRELGPGPGQYYQGDKGLGGSNYSFPRGQRMKGKLRQPSPGPGSYTVKLPKGKSATFSEKFESGGLLKSNLGGPGPASYTAGVADPLKYTAGPKYGFGTSTRQTGTLKSGIVLPGPGHYGKSVAFTGSGAKFSIKSRPIARSESLGPGPGSSVALVSSFG